MSNKGTPMKKDVFEQKNYVNTEDDQLKKSSAKK